VRFSPFNEQFFFWVANRWCTSSKFVGGKFNMAFWMKLYCMEISMEINRILNEKKPDDSFIHVSNFHIIISISTRHDTLFNHIFPFDNGTISFWNRIRIINLKKLLLLKYYRAFTLGRMCWSCLGVRLSLFLVIHDLIGAYITTSSSTVKSSWKISDDVKSWQSTRFPQELPSNFLIFQ
jgi:hypothetical protein